MITAPGTIMITDRQSAGPPRHAPARAVTSHLDETTIVNTFRYLGHAGHAHQDLPRNASDSSASASAVSTDSRERDRPIVKHP